LFAIGGTIECLAQKPKPENLRKYDRQWIHFGFLLGLNSSDFNVHLSPDIRDLKTVYVVEAERGGGFSLGIVSNLRLGEFFDLRSIPSLSFAQRTLTYSMLDKNNLPDTVSKKIESTFLEFPLTLKYKAVRINNGRAYVLGGMRYSLDLASQKDAEREADGLVKLKRHDFLYEIGFGIDFYLKYFKLSPVIMLSLGINNMLVKEEDNIYSMAIDRLTSKIIQFSVTFE